MSFRNASHGQDGPVTAEVSEEFRHLLRYCYPEPGVVVNIGVMSEPSPAGHCSVCGVFIPRGMSVFITQEDLETVPVEVCRQCAHVDLELDP